MDCCGYLLLSPGVALWEFPQSRQGAGAGAAGGAAPPRSPAQGVAVEADLGWGAEGSDRPLP